MHNQSLAETNRQTWIDELKGFAIFLVVLGHMPYVSDTIILKHMIYSFHMPLFFLLAGCTAAISANRYSNYVFLKNRFISLLIPYIVWSIIHGTLFTKSISELSNYSIMSHWESMVQGDVTNWFLITLFTLIFLLYIYKSTTKKLNIIGKVAVAIILFFLIFILHKLFGKSEETDYRPLEFLTSAYVYFIPFSLGVVMMRYEKIKNIFVKNNILIFFCVTISLVTPGLLSTIHIGSNYPKIITGICVSCLLIRFLHNNQLDIPYVKNIRIFFSYIGKHSLGIYLMSSMMLPHSSLPLTSGVEAFVVYGIYSVVVCILCILLENLICTSDILALLLFGKRTK